MAGERKSLQKGEAAIEIEVKPREVGVLEARGRMYFKELMISNASGSRRALEWSLDWKCGGHLL